MRSWGKRACAAVLLVSSASALAEKPAPDKQALAALTGEASVAELRTAMTKGTLTAEALTRAAISRIEAENGKLHAVIALNPDAVKEARRIDAARKAGTDLGAMMGIPVLIKDNIETWDPIPTTAGSLAL